MTRFFPPDSAIAAQMLQPLIDIAGCIQRSQYGEITVANVPYSGGLLFLGLSRPRNCWALNEAVDYGLRDRLRSISHAQAGAGIGDIVINRSARDTKCLTNFGGGFAARDQHQAFKLSA
jgi:hypothetical protein